ncbi:hypothetical protein HW130_03170 [Streptomyces sp. PKU-EA00015]|uniref:hypothetical protein n=1 Tax=Streptomyces sp. PKU-EA00015 TaxID=2748326 RepID=UPI0015A04094|nr:hypothetical protein [Streptomyces sp. PKU-EA00015]NWF25273.1 hypothetical protein [Streptomyces sp. PKU-EA00015]
MTGQQCGLPHYDYPFSRCTESAGHDGPHAAPLVIDASLPPCGGISWDAPSPQPAAAPTDPREQYAAAIRSVRLGDSETLLDDTNVDIATDAALAVRDRELEQLRAQVARVRELAERWENALTPDLAYARALRRALDPQESS